MTLLTVSPLESHAKSYLAVKDLSTAKTVRCRKSENDFPFTYLYQMM